MAEQTRITFGDLAARISTGKLDICSNDWGQSNADDRRQIVDSLTSDETLEHLLAIAEQGLITPLSPASCEPLGKTLADKDSLLTREDADVVVRSLRVFVNRKARRRAEEKAKVDAGRYTLEEAARELSANTGREFDRCLELIVNHVKQGGLPLKNPRDFGDRLPYSVPGVIRVWYEQVTNSDLNIWLERHPEWGIAYRFATAGALARAKKAETKQQQMIRQFSQAIFDLGLDPHALPMEKRGRPGVRSKVASALGLSTTNKSFAHHWDRALKDRVFSFAKK